MVLESVDKGVATCLTRLCGALPTPDVLVLVAHLLHVLMVIPHAGGTR